MGLVTAGVQLDVGKQTLDLEGRTVNQIGARIYDGFAAIGTNASLGHILLLLDLHAVLDAHVKETNGPVFLFNDGHVYEII